MVFAAPKGRNLNSLGREPQEQGPKQTGSPEGATPTVTVLCRPFGAPGGDTASNLGLTPQAIQIPPFQGGGPSPPATPNCYHPLHEDPPARLRQRRGCPGGHRDGDSRSPTAAGSPTCAPGSTASTRRSSPSGRAWRSPWTAGSSLPIRSWRKAPRWPCCRRSRAARERSPRAELTDEPIDIRPVERRRRGSEPGRRGALPRHRARPPRRPARREAHLQRLPPHGSGGAPPDRGRPRSRPRGPPGGDRPPSRRGPGGRGERRHRRSAPPTAPPPTRPAAPPWSGSRRRSRSGSASTTRTARRRGGRRSRWRRRGSNRTSHLQHCSCRRIILTWTSEFLGPESDRSRPPSPGSPRSRRPSAGGCGAPP